MNDPQKGAADMHTIRAAHASDGRPSLPDTATEVVHQDRLVGVRRGPGPTRLRA
jgi:hypothetical protein